MYSTDYDSFPTSKTVDYSVAAKSGFFNFSSEASTQTDDPDFDKVTATFAVAVITGAEKSGSKLVFTGNTEILAVLTNSSGVYLSKTYSAPFRAETDAGATADPFTYRANAEVISAVSKVDGKTLSTHIETGITYATFNESTAEAISACAVYRDSPRKRSGCLTLCYPAKNDTLWTVAKKYGVTCRNLALSNGIQQDEKLPGVLMIPKSGENTSAKLGII